MPRTNAGKHLLIAVLALAVIRVAVFEKARRRSWQRCAQLVASVVETRRPAAAERWRGVLEPIGGYESVGESYARLRLPVGPHPWPGPVIVRASLALASGPVTLAAQPRCEPPRHNPTDGDFFAAFRLPTLRLQVVSATSRPADGGAEAVVAAVVKQRARLGERLAPWPRLFAVARAAWTGELSVLPPAWVAAIRDGGALAVVALSGQHVALVAGWILLALTVLARWLPPRGLYYARFRGCVSPVVAGAFVALGSGAPSTIRAAVTVVAAGIFSRRGLLVAPARAAVLTAASTVIVFPDFLASPGYLLSVVGAVCLARVAGGRASWKRALLLPIVLPILLAPLVVYCFARLPLLSIFVGVLLGFIWEGLILPVAFIGLPLVAWLPESAFVATASSLENALGLLERALLFIGPTLARSVVVLPVPTPAMLVAIYAACHGITILLARRFPTEKPWNTMTWK